MTCAYAIEGAFVTLCSEYTCGVGAAYHVHRFLVFQSNHFLLVFFRLSPNHHFMQMPRFFDSRVSNNSTVSELGELSGLNWFRSGRLMYCKAHGVAGEERGGQVQD